MFSSVFQGVHVVSTSVQVVKGTAIRELGCPKLLRYRTGEGAVLAELCRQRLEGSDCSSTHLMIMGVQGHSTKDHRRTLPPAMTKVVARSGSLFIAV